jgi:hypothetical protein
MNQIAEIVVEEVVVTVDEITTNRSVIDVQVPTSDAFNVITEGIQGPPGPSTFGGYVADVKDPQNGDVVTFKDSKWINVRRTEISDGGNF